MKKTIFGIICLVAASSANAGFLMGTMVGAASCDDRSDIVGETMVPIHKSIMKIESLLKTVTLTPVVRKQLEVELKNIKSIQ